MNEQAIKHRIKNLENKGITSVFSLYELEALYLILTKIKRG